MANNQAEIAQTETSFCTKVLDWRFDSNERITTHSCCIYSTSHGRLYQNIWCFRQSKSFFWCWCNCAVMMKLWWVRIMLLIVDINIIIISSSLISQDLCCCNSWYDASLIGTDSTMLRFTMSNFTAVVVPTHPLMLLLISNQSIDAAVDTLSYYYVISNHIVEYYIKYMFDTSQITKLYIIICIIYLIFI